MQEEIKRSVKNISPNKSPGGDNLLNEYFIEGMDLLEKPLELLFNVNILLATSKTYIGSVLFRTSAYIGAKQASRVPFWFRDLSCQNHLVPGHLVPFFSSESSRTTFRVTSSYFL